MTEMVKLEDKKREIKSDLKNAEGKVKSTSPKVKIE